MLLYHYSNEPYTELKTKQAQGKITPEEMEQEDKYALFRHDVSPSYAEISFLPDPIPLDIIGALYAGHDHHIWIPDHEIYEHIVDSKELPPFKYHITETPDDVKQMFRDWPDNPTPEQKRAYFQAKNARKWKTGENGEGNKELEKNFSKYVNGTRNAYLTAVPLFDDYNWKQYAPMVPHVQINPEGGIAKLLRPARKVKIGKANVAVSLESYKGLHIPFSAKW